MMIDVSGIPSSRADAVAAGAKFYFTGAPCSRGHVALRNVTSCNCIECVRAYKKEYTKQNKDKIREYKASWYTSNKERAAAKFKERYYENRELLLAYQKEYAAKNPEKRREIRQRWALLNPDKTKECAREYRKNNKEKTRVRSHKRLALLKKAEGYHSVQDLKRIRAAQKDRCGCCKTKLNGGGHLDHIIAIANGGSNWPRNLQFLCESCNCSKRHRDPIDFMRSRGRLL